MKELICHKLQHDFKRIKTSAKWVLFSIVSGLLVGGVGTLFYFGMYVVTLTRTKNPWLIFLLPVSGILIVGCYRLLHDEKDTGTNLVSITPRKSGKNYWMECNDNFRTDTPQSK